MVQGCERSSVQEIAELYSHQLLILQGGVTLVGPVILLNHRVLQGGRCIYPLAFGLNMKLQSFGHLMWRADSFGKDPDAGKDWGQEKKGMAEDETVGWHHRLNGHGFGWTPGVGDVQGGLVCCGSWGLKESGMTERLNWTEHARLVRAKTLHQETLAMDCLICLPKYAIKLFSSL